MNINLLTNYDQYKRLKRPTPYFFIIRNKRQVLYYFGAKHSYDPSHEQFLTLKNFWKDFIIETQNKNCIVLIEGSKRPIMDSEEEAIKRGGEVHFITFLAAKNNIETKTPEPDQKLENKELLKQFSKEEIIYYYFARTVSQWNRHPQKPEFKTYIQPYLKKDEEVSQWPNFEFSLNHMKLIHKNLFGTDFNELNSEFFNKIVNPTLTISIINKVAATSSRFREIKILQEIEKLWKNGKNIFVVYGQGHAVVQEPVLKTLTKTLKIKRLT